MESNKWQLWVPISPYQWIPLTVTQPPEQTITVPRELRVFKVKRQEKNRMQRVKQDPDAHLPWGFDWSAWLDEGEELLSSEWIEERGELVLSNLGVQDGTATGVMISGGRPGVTYRVTNRVRTVSGLQDDRSLILTVEER